MYWKRIGWKSYYFAEWINFWISENCPMYFSSVFIFILFRTTQTPSILSRPFRPKAAAAESQLAQ